MAILEEEVWVGLSGRNINHYENLGYKIPRSIDNQNRLRIIKGSKILVKIDHIPRGSSVVRVTKICDDCGIQIPGVLYGVIINSRKNGDGKDRCKSCVGKWTNGGYKVNEINCLWNTHPEVAKLLKYPQRGHEITYGRSQKETFICAKCGHEQDKEVYNVIIQGLACSKCSDGITFPEKIMFSVLDQLGVNFETQKVFNWSKNIKHINKKLCGKKKYDFYIPSSTKKENIIIEVHGMQHYEEGFYTEGSKTIDEEKENDFIKENLAKKNGINNYIVIDCRYSELEFIKNNILNSRLSKIFDLSNTDWEKSFAYTCTSMIKMSCDLWNGGIEDTKEISKILKLGRNTVTKYLKHGVKLGICNYSPSKNKGSLIEETPVVQVTLDGEYIREYKSMAEAAKETGIKKGTIWACCKKQMKSIDDYRWFYTEEYEKVKNNLKPIEKAEYRKTIVQLDLKGNFIKEWKSATDASKEIGISNKTICYAMKKEDKTYGRYKWMYKKDYEKQLESILNN